MRRKDREIMKIEEILEIMEACQVCSLALTDGGYPYVVPVNFGVERVGDSLCLYFHGRGEGKKMELIQKGSGAAFCMTTEEEVKLLEPACATTMLYKSVCGRGRIEVLEETEEKLRGLTCIMRQYDRDKKDGFDFDARAVEKTAVLRLTAEEVSGKSNRKREQEA